MANSSELKAGSVAPPIANPPAKIRWYVPTPTKLLALMLLVQVVLFLSQHFQWFSINKEKGLVVVVAMAATSLFVFLMLFWFVLGSFFGSKAQFSLATLMLLVPVMAIPCAWFARDYQQARQQQELTASGLSHGFRLIYHKRSPWGPFPHYVPESIGKLLIAQLGIDFFDDLDRIDIPKADDESLETVARFANLKGLRLSEARVSDAGIGHLKRLTGLKEFELVDYRRSLTDAALLHLSELPELELLHLHNMSLTDAGVKHLERFPKLKDVRFDMNRLSDDGLATLAKTRGAIGIWEVNLTNSAVTDAGMKHLKALTEAMHVDLEGTRVTDVGVAELSQMHKLSYLNVSRTKVSDAGLEKLAGLKQLNWLGANHTRVGNKGLACLKTHTQLTRLDLQDTPVNDAGLANLAGLARLKKLDLSHTQATDAGLELIKGLTTLTSLDLSGTKVTDAGLHCVSTLRVLESLNLTYTQVSDAGLDSLLDLTYLENLYVFGTRITDDGAAKIRKAFPKCTVY